MSKTERKPILNASLPAQFRQIRIVLAREPYHPEGDAEVAYIFVAPVDPEGRIDPKLWRAHREACRVARQRPNNKTSLVISSIIRAAPGVSTTTAKPVYVTTSAIISPTSASSPANMSRLTKVARCTPTA